MSINSSSWSPHIVLAECEVGIIDPLVAMLEQAGWPIMGTCSTTPQVLEILTQQSVDLLLLGNLAEANCFEVFRECRDRWKDLPIILISHQPVSQYFRDWALRQGARDAVQGDVKSLPRLKTAIEQVLPLAARSTRSLPVSSGSAPPSAERSRQKTSKNSSKNPGLEPSLKEASTFQASKLAKTANHRDAHPHPLLAGSTVREALAELTHFSINYFGPLATGNYLRKAHQKMVIEHPWLEQWQVDHFGQVTIPDSLQDSPIDQEQRHSIQAWIQCFEQECQRIIIDFPALLRKEDTSENLKRLLP